MRLTSILTSVLCELGIGTALFVCLQKTGEIRKSFFSFQSGLVAACLFLAWLTSLMWPSWFLALPAAGICGLAAAWCFSRERVGCGKIALLTAATFAASSLEADAMASVTRTAADHLSVEW